MTTGPWPVAAACATLLCPVAGYHLVRLLRLIRCDRRSADVDVAHAVMAGAMVLMVAGEHSAAPWSSIAFLTGAAWFGARAAREYVLRGSAAVAAHLITAVSCAAMGYMLVPSSAAHAAMPQMAGARPAWTNLVAQPTVGWLLVFVLTLTAVRDAMALAHGRTDTTTGTSCRLAMSVVGGYFVALSS